MTEYTLNSNENQLGLPRYMLVGSSFLRIVALWQRAPPRPDSSAAEMMAITPDTNFAFASSFTMSFSVTGERDVATTAPAAKIMPKATHCQPLCLRPTAVHMRRVVKSRGVHTQVSSPTRRTEQKVNKYCCRNQLRLVKDDEQRRRSIVNPEHHQEVLHGKRQCRQSNCSNTLA